MPVALYPCRFHWYFLQGVHLNASGMAISGKLLDTWDELLKVKKQTMFGEPQQIS